MSNNEPTRAESRAYSESVWKSTPPQPTARHLAAEEIWPEYSNEWFNSLSDYKQTDAYPYKRLHEAAQKKREQIAAIIAKHSERGGCERGREAFEKWATEMPYERAIHRFGEDETQYAWPGQYRDIAVQLAWEAWQAAESLPSLEGELADALRQIDSRAGNWVPDNGETMATIRNFARAALAKFDAKESK